MVKLSKQNKSVRILNLKHLVVDWMGNKNLFYQMTRAQLKKGLKSGIVSVKQYLRDESPEITAFTLTLRPSGSMAIGCENFTRNDVRKMEQWMREKRG